jgi:hypothetical protein
MVRANLVDYTLQLIESKRFLKCSHLYNFDVWIGRVFIHSIYTGQEVHQLMFPRAIKVTLDFNQINHLSRR